jgi:hypothetical protein
MPHEMGADAIRDKKSVIFFSVTVGPVQQIVPLYGATVQAPEPDPSAKE